MSKRLRFFTYFGVLLLLHFVGVLILVVSPREATASEIENRMLAGFPSLSFKSVFSGEFASGFESYLSDRFPLRYTWTDAADKCMNTFSLLSEEQQIRLTNLDETAFSDDEDEDSESEMEEAAGTETEETFASDDGFDPEPEEENDWEKADSVSTDAPPESTVVNVVVAETAATATPVPAATPVPSATPIPSASPVPTSAPSSAPPAKLTAAEVKELKREYYQIEKAGKKDPSVTSVDLIGADGSVTSVYTYPNWRIEQCANVVNRLTALLPDDGQLYFTYVPRAQFFKQYYLGLDKYVDFHSGVEDYIAPFLNDRVKLFSTAEILEPHVRAGEYVFFNTDHHWSLLGAWYVHQAMIESQGLKAVPFNDNGWEPGGTFRGSLAQQKNPIVKRDEVDTIEIISPAMPYDFYTLTHLATLTPRKLYERDKGGYAGYLGSNRGPWRLIRSYENNGRKMLLIGDSMANAIAPFLLSYYDEIHYMCPKGEQSFDITKAGGTIKDFIDTYGIDDIYVVSTNFIGSESYRVYLNQYMGD